MPPLFRKLALRGQAGSILWGHRTAARVATWSILRKDHDGRPPYTWHLRARVAPPFTAGDAFQCRQRPLLFTAQRDRGFWCWGIESIEIVGLDLRATLGPPEG